MAWQNSNKKLISISVALLLFGASCSAPEQQTEQTSIPQSIAPVSVESIAPAPESINPQPVQNTNTATVNKAVVAPAPEPEPEPAPSPPPPPVQKNTNSSETNSNCHPSYSGCLRADASDYDCSGGSGNGPYYTGRVNVIGPDEFDLDRDNDGVGCE